ncbi:hypothetical protein PCE1_004403 [Barthelona sp. PCE]
MEYSPKSVNLDLEREQAIWRTQRRLSQIDSQKLLKLKMGELSEASVSTDSDVDYDDDDEKAIIQSVENYLSNVPQDRFGFLLNEKENMGERDREILEEELSYLKEYNEILSNFDKFYWNPLGRASNRHQKRLKKLIRTCVPDHFRAELWRKLLRVEDKKLSHPDLYLYFLNKPLPDKIEYDISKDLERTFPKNTLFLDRNNMMIDQLRNVLHSVVNYDLDLGYVQGMGFITGVFLMYMSEEDAFYCMLSLLHDEPWMLRLNFLQGLPGIHRSTFVQSGIIRKFLPGLLDHMERCGGDWMMATQSMYFSLFLYNYPFTFCLRFMDMLLSEGPKMFYRVSLGLLTSRKNEIKAMDQFEMAAFLTRGIAEVDSIDEILTHGFKYSLSRKLIDRLTAEYDEANSFNPSPSPAIPDVEAMDIDIATIKL